MKEISYSTFANGRIKRTKIDGRLSRMVAVLDTGDIVLTDAVKARAVFHRDRKNGGRLYVMGITGSDALVAAAGGVL